MKINKKATRTLIFPFLVFLISCSGPSHNTQLTSNEGKVEFEFLDSLVVESLSELYLADKNENTGQLLFNERQMNELIITDLEGKIISSFEPTGEGPDKVESPLEVAFWKEGIVIKEMSSENKFNFFDRDFRKTAQSPPLTKGLSFITIYNSNRSFSIFEKDCKTLILGQELNLLDEQLLAEKSENSLVYEKAEIGYIYDVDSKDITRINLYPETWKPRLEQKWVGFKSSYIQVSKTDKKVAVLPSVGNELFFYELNGNSLSPIAQISLFHPERNENFIFDVKKEYFLYPLFTQLFSGGNYFLVEFYTEVPQDIYDSFRAKGEGYQSDPEYWETLQKHWKAKYILTDKNGNQASISELPVPGVVHFMDANDIVYIKPTSKTELDYNVFYRYRVTLK
ncbi:hypothetical protein MMU07_06955 [Aquiflexum sp. LQ15W]|uniref:hypothetical protein n=1 Tax=Cognataquiflexum nitidum TaxID=2922272 RepID=UPI001F131B8F|nr:hypothetical protein [Cognataquiflexum nitidum]MCH6199308.1 hypothetical protein [Cognataquiflexum nitidum]